MPRQQRDFARDHAQFRTARTARREGRAVFCRDGRVGHVGQSGQHVVDGAAKIEIDRTAGHAIEDNDRRVLAPVKRPLRRARDLAQLRAIHPLGKSPVVTDNGNTIAESGAIAEYILDTYGEGRLIPPPKTPERLRYTYWLHYAEGSAMPPLLLKLLFTLMPKRAPALLRPLVRKVSNQALTTLVNPQLKQHMAFWEGELGKSEWFAGNQFTAADIQMSFPLEAAAARGGLEQGHPRAMAFLERIHARPAYNRALDKGGPYTVGR